MTVWVVTQGERAYGRSVCGVFASFAAAKNALEKNADDATARFVGGWVLARAGSGVEIWENGCDQLAIERWEVRS